MTTAALILSPLWQHPATSRTMFVRPGRTERPQSIGTAWEIRAIQPQPSFAIIEAKKSLQVLGLTAATVKNVEAFLETVCTPQSTVPSIAYGDDEDTALLHWIAGPMSIEVEIGPKGATYFWGIDQDGLTQAIEGSQLQIESMTRRLVGVIADRVQKSNPEWRHQYRPK